MYCLAREECGTSRWKVGSTCCHVLVVRPGAHRASNIFYVQAQEVPERTGQGKEKGTRAEGRIRTGAHILSLQHVPHLCRIRPSKRLHPHPLKSARTHRQALIQARAHASPHFHLQSNPSKRNLTRECMPLPLPPSRFPTPTGADQAQKLYSHPF